MTGMRPWKGLSSRTEGTTGALVHDWWTRLDDDDRAGRAELRRCADTSAVAFVPAYHRLCAAIRQGGFDIDEERLAAVAGVVAVIRQDTPLPVYKTPGAQLARREGERPVVSELRFRRLLETAALADRYAALRRVAAQLEAVDVGGFAKAAYGFPGTLKKKWAYDYYELTVSKESTR